MKGNRQPRQPQYPMQPQPVPSPYPNDPYPVQYGEPAPRQHPAGPSPSPQPQSSSGFGGMRDKFQGLRMQRPMPNPMMPASSNYAGAQFGANYGQQVPNPQFEQWTRQTARYPDRPDSRGQQLMMLARLLGGGR